MNPTFSLLQLFTLQYAFDGCAINMITDDNRSQYRKGEINIIHEVSIETIFIKRGRKLKQNKQTRQIFVKMKRKVNNDLFWSKTLMRTSTVFLYWYTLCSFR